MGENYAEMTLKARWRSHSHAGALHFFRQRFSQRRRKRLAGRIGGQRQNRLKCGDGRHVQNAVASALPCACGHAGQKLGNHRRQPCNVQGNHLLVGGRRHASEQPLRQHTGAVDQYIGRVLFALERRAQPGFCARYRQVNRLDISRSALAAFELTRTSMPTHFSTNGFPAA